MYVFSFPFNICEYLNISDTYFKEVYDIGTWEGPNKTDSIVDRDGDEFLEGRDLRR